MLGSDKGDTAYLHLEELSSTLAVVGRDDRGMNVHKAIVLEEENSLLHLHVKQFQENLLHSTIKTEGRLFVGIWEGFAVSLANLEFLILLSQPPYIIAPDQLNVLLYTEAYKMLNMEQTQIYLV